MTEISASDPTSQDKGNAKVDEPMGKIGSSDGQALGFKKLMAKTSSILQDKGKSKVEPTFRNTDMIVSSHGQALDIKKLMAETNRILLDIGKAKVAEPIIGDIFDMIDSYSDDQTLEFKTTPKTCGSGPTTNAKPTTTSPRDVKLIDDDQILEFKKMAEKIASVGKDKVGEPALRMDSLMKNTEEILLAFEENELDSPRTSLPLKKRRLLEANEQKENGNIHVERDRIPRRIIAPPNTHPKQLGPGSRYYRTKDMCISKTLTPHDVSKEIARLDLDVFEATVLSDDPEIVYFGPATYSKDIMVFDKDNRRYHMTLSNYIRVGRMRYTLYGDWTRFVRAHDLKVGDEITFYQLQMKSVGTKVYAIKYIRKPADHSVAAIKTGNKANDDGQSDSKGGYYKLDTMLKETSGGLLLRFSKN